MFSLDMILKKFVISLYVAICIPQANGALQLVQVVRKAIYLEYLSQFSQINSVPEAWGTSSDLLHELSNRSTRAAS